MCGIVGIVDLAGHPVDPDLVGAMNRCIVHRGPDDDGFWFGDGAGLAMRRLSIIDVAGGTQPLTDESARVITVYNGEIYNFRELSDTLRQHGHTLHTRCDTEVIPHLYEDHGVDFVHHLKGMFGIAVWDRDRQSLVLVRDRLGIKPLYYTTHQGRFYFASELKSLAPCGLLRAMSNEAVYHYLTYGFVPAPLTIYEHVYKLAPGHRLEVVNGVVTTERYWDVHYEEGPPRPEEEQIETLHDLLLEAVKLRLISDVPLGAFLSGGVDSSLVVALMCAATNAPVKTFSIRFDDPSHDESPYARTVASRFGTDHTEFTVRPDIAEQIQPIILQFDEPFADSSAIPTYCLSEQTRQHVTVAMSGDGGDELFGGYDRYHDFFRKRPLYRIPQPLRRASFAALGNLLPRGTRGKRFLRSLGLNCLEDYVFGGSELTHAELLEPDLLASLPGIHPQLPAREFLDRSVPSELDTLCLHDLGLYLPDDILTKVDRTSMAVSLEVRVPLLDHHVVEFAARLPPSLRLRGRTGKYILKRVLERYLPHEHVHRRKRGFAIPLDRWFREDLRTLLLDVLSPAQVRESGVFRPSAVEFLLGQHMNGTRDHKPLLWRLFVFQVWAHAQRRFGRVAAAPADQRKLRQAAAKSGT